MAAVVLVVDDNPINLKLVTRVLEADGYAVQQAVNAENALEQLRAGLSPMPELILMDVELPEMSGIELTRILKSDPALRSIPVVALTAYAMKGDEQKARDAGCAGYITKPIDTRTFCAQIREFLGKGNQSQATRILIVEDAPSDLKLARVILTSAGYEVIEADTGEKALSLMRETRPDLILLDLNLPGIKGVALIREVRDDAATRDIPIVAITSYPSDWTQREAQEAGCTAYFSKPVDSTALLARFADIISNRKSPKSS